MNESNWAGVADDTLRVLRTGRYVAPSGRAVSVLAALRLAKAGTRSYPPDAGVPVPAFAGRPARIEVENASTLEVAGRWAADGVRVAALNFASAKNPGGGFRTGARAQEESLARASGLFATLDGDPMYAFHRPRSDPIYSPWVIYSPDVPVFRRDDGRLLERPFPCSFLTSPAVNAGALRHAARRGDEIRAAMRERVGRVLAVAARHGHGALVLGAWGCGAFGNDPEAIAGLFREALGGPFRGAFARVAFAVLDRPGRGGALAAFERAFGKAARA